MTLLGATSDDTMEEAEKDGHLALPVSYPELFQYPPLPYVQLCICPNDVDDPDALVQFSVFPIVMQHNDAAETTEDVLPPSHLSCDMDDKASMGNENVNPLRSLNDRMDPLGEYRSIYDIMEDITASSSSSESSARSSYSDKEEERKWSRDRCSSDGETLSTESTVDYCWWNFDTVDWNPKFPHHFPKTNDRQGSQDDENIESSGVWYFGVPNLDDFGTNAILLNQYKDFHDRSERQMYATTDATCGQWLQRILVVRHKRCSPRIRIQKSVCTEYPKLTTLPRRSYSVLP